jgi:hypothetical protein
MKLPIYLYNNVFELILDLDDNNRINRVMYQRDLVLQKGIKNKIQLQFKNSDQKLLNITTGTFVFVLFDPENQRSLIQKEVTILDDGATLALRGLGQVEFTESDMEACESTYYKAGIKALDTSDNSYVPTYANTYYGVGATVEVKHDLYPTMVPSQEVTKFEVYYNSTLPFQQYEYYTGNLNAHPEQNSNEALHTVAVYMTNFKGQVIVEGTLENSPPTFGNYAVINTYTYNKFSGINYYNFNGVFSKIRVRYIPTKNPITGQNNDTAFAGTVDKVLYRS